MDPLTWIGVLSFALFGSGVASEISRRASGPCWVRTVWENEGWRATELCSEEAAREAARLLDLDLSSALPALRLGMERAIVLANPDGRATFLRLRKEGSAWRLDALYGPSQTIPDADARARVPEILAQLNARLAHGFLSVQALPEGAQIVRLVSPLARAAVAEEVQVDLTPKNEGEEAYALLDTHGEVRLGFLVSPERCLLTLAGRPGRDVFEDDASKIRAFLDAARLFTGPSSPCPSSSRASQEPASHLPLPSPVALLSEDLP